jgi:hypothetical protein
MNNFIKKIDLFMTIDLFMMFIFLGVLCGITIASMVDIFTLSGEKIFEICSEQTVMSYEACKLEVTR